MNKTAWIRKRLHEQINSIANSDVNRHDKVMMLEGFYMALAPLTTELDWDYNSKEYQRIIRHYNKIRYSC